MRGILRYITETLKEPVIAQRIYSSIKKQIMALDQMPLRFPFVRDELFAARGLRKMPVENYFVFYVVDESLKEVHILRVLYNRRDWQSLL
jgi:toxin ParE1/3/4